MTSTVRVAVAATAFLVLAPSRPWAQETSAGKNPISPEECRKDKKMAPDCQRLGVTYAEGRDVVQDLAKAESYLDAACRASVPEACRQLGSILLDDRRSQADHARGTRLFQTACKQKDIVACGALEDARVARDCALGKPSACEQACDRGERDVCLGWGLRLSATKGADPAAAVRAFRLACNAGSGVGCLGLAKRTKDEASAAGLHERACELGASLGCEESAVDHYLGRGVAADPARAVALFATACEKDELYACMMLGGVYARGEMGADAKEKGQAYLKQACAGDVECLAVVANGGIPAAWGGSAEALRPKASPPGPDPSGAGSDYDQPPRLLHMTRPQYPREAFKRKIEGVVELAIVIDAYGRVADIRVSRSIPLLDVAAIDCVRQWRFVPARRNGVPVNAYANAPIRFSLLP